MEKYCISIKIVYNATDNLRRQRKEILLEPRISRIRRIFVKDRIKDKVNPAKALRRKEKTRFF